MEYIVLFRNKYISNLNIFFCFNEIFYKICIVLFIFKYNFNLNISFVLKITCNYI